MSADNKPIGWWLKELDRLLEESFEQLLAADGLNRRQWQALNAAREEEPIAVALAPFLSADPAELAAVTDPLTARGWLAGDRLTPEGEAALTRLAEQVRAQRGRVTRGVTDSEYRQTVDVLRRMAGNLQLEGPGNGSAV